MGIVQSESLVSSNSSARDPADFLRQQFFSYETGSDSDACALHPPGATDGPGDTRLYDMFNLRHNCTSDEIRKAYRKQALPFFPGRCREESADEKQAEQRATVAYDILSGNS